MENLIKDLDYWVVEGYDQTKHNLITDGSVIKGFILKPTMVTQPRLLSPRSFMKRFSVTERVSIRESDNAYVKDFLYELNLSSDVNLDFPEVESALGLLVSLGILEESRIVDIMADPTEAEAI